MVRGVRLLLALAVGLALVGCGQVYRPRPIPAGVVTLTADLQGYAPDLPGWVFVLVPWDEVPAGSDGGPLNLELASSDGSQGWRVDPTAMALLPANAGFFASGASNTAGIVLVYQAPHDSLESACLRGQYRNAESGSWAYLVDAGLTPLPPMPTATGASSIPRIPAGQTVTLGDCAMRVDKVVNSDRVGGYSIEDARFIAVIATVTPLSNDARCASPYDIGLVFSPAAIDRANDLATALALPKQGGISNTSADGSVTATVVFTAGYSDQPYLVFTDSSVSHIRFDLGLADAGTVADIAPDQPLIPLGQTVASSVLIVTVRGASIVGNHLVVQLDLTNPSYTEIVQYCVFLLDGDGHFVRASNVSTSLYDKRLAQDESITGTLEFHTSAPEGSRLLLWSGTSNQAPDQLSLWTP